MPFIYNIYRYLIKCNYNAIIMRLILRRCAINASLLLVWLEDNPIDMCNNKIKSSDYAEFMNPKEVNNFVQGWINSGFTR